DKNNTKGIIFFLKIAVSVSLAFITSLTLSINFYERVKKIVSKRKKEIVLGLIILLIFVIIAFIISKLVFLTT
ncbi:MAG: hypothetical protein KC550_04810, partial [Nanoarchaeota archaeon]|nr:hypothetical protein [Nanoarchaeota archaeon]